MNYIQRAICTTCGREIIIDQGEALCIFCHAAKPQYKPQPVTEVDRRDAHIVPKPDTGGPHGWVEEFKDSIRVHRPTLISTLWSEWVPDLPYDPECDYDTTPHRFNGYRLWFRAYGSASPVNHWDHDKASSDLIVGCWIAWPDIATVPLEKRNSDNMRFFASLCGGDSVQPYMKGQNLPNWDQMSTTTSTPSVELERLKMEAFLRLSDHIKSSYPESYDE